jgi:hypothetical protein
MLGVTPKAERISPSSSALGPVAETGSTRLTLLMVFSFYLLEGENCRSADGSRRTGADIIVCPLATQETALANSDGEAFGEGAAGAQPSGPSASAPAAGSFRMIRPSRD